MPKKYHIATKAMPLELAYVSKFSIVRGENCINCGKCTKVCIYEAHKRGKKDPRKVADPTMADCRNCFRCIQECPRGALVKSLDEDFLKLGGSYWKPDIFLSIWKQAGDGKVPVSGAGYRGPFTGPGFDSMWTDMSEIVRPTRDGIHGREYISTAVDLGRKLPHLSFTPDGGLATSIPDTVDLPLPILFDLPAADLTGNVQAALLLAAREIETFAVLPAAAVTGELKKYAKNIIPLLSHDSLDACAELIKDARIVALEYAPALTENFSAAQAAVKKTSGAITMVRVPATPDVENIVVQLARSGAEVIHVVADYRGRPVGGGDSKLVNEIIRGVHLRLVEEHLRDEVTLIVSGGIAMAEHVPKAIICGADATAIDLPLLIALGARLYEEPEQQIVLPRGLEKIPVEVITQRLVNLMGAWHSQLLEVMGAMGIREARRLRGESGRAIFFNEIDADTFGKIFKQQETASV